MKEGLLTEVPSTRSRLTSGRAAFGLMVMGCALWAAVEMNTEKPVVYSEATAEEVELAAACSFSVEFETMRGNVAFSGSGTGAYMQFLVGGRWTPKEWFFHRVGNPGAGATSGQSVTKQFAINQWPTKISIQAGGNDALGYSRIEFVVGNVRIPIVNAPSNIDLSYPKVRGAPQSKYWVDGDQIAPLYNVFPVPSLAAGSFTVNFETMNGGVKFSGSGTGAKVQFLVNGHWTPLQWLFHRVGNPGAGASNGEKASTSFPMSQWPTKMSIQAGGNDALGYQHIDFTLPSGVVFNIVDAPKGMNLAYPTTKTAADMKYWVDGDEVAPLYNVFNVPPKPCAGR